MSSDLAFFATLSTIRENIFKYGGVFLLCAGTVSCVLSLFVFSKKTFRKNPCGIYLIATSIANFIMIYISLLETTLSTGYKNDVTVSNLSFCRISLYLTFVSDNLSSYFLIMGSIDRMLLTSRNALTRQRSTCRLAYISIIGISIFWLIFHIHALILPDIIQLYPTYFACYFPSGSYLTFITFYLLIRIILTLSLMVIFGLFTVRNIQNMRQRQVLPSVQGTESSTQVTANTVRSKDHLLIRVLLLDIAVYMIFNLLLAAILLYQQIIQNRPVGQYESQVVTFITGVATFSNYFPYCIGFYTKLFISKVFRKEVTASFLCE
ncbi:unnamed protein product [Adineta ricciae]|uniref:G-protein coupled receptors family 1 profile domain-containing protein n=1 Tax=Adineta ricciae TaxID=249248 RepID=A0A815VWH7_ADIRI|nr:unnamed protein product [Adineta ricciae]CAF1540889.1 unnamed protein product [Adineta ricciae]